MKKFIVFLLTLLCLFTVSVSINNVVVEAVSSTYYSGTEDLTGTALLNKLTQITKKNHTYYTSYDDIKTMNHESDPDPNNPNNLLDFYSRISVPAKWDQGDTWNREHVWCQSLSGGLYGTSGAGSDIHHIRPTISSINSSRGNKKYTDFDLIPANGSENRYNGVLVAYDNSNYWEPLDNVKGDTARILMYMYMHYSKEVSVNSSFSKAGNLSITNIVYAGGTKAQAWKLLLYWNELDPVDTYEANRNEYCASVTGTRNPFIDNPEFADAIWGDGSGNVTPETYSVNYLLQPGANFNYTDTTKYAAGTKIKEPSVEPTLDGYTFDGWYSDASRSTRWDFETNTITSNLTLFAKFIKNDVDEFEVVFDQLSIKSQLTFDVFDGKIVDGSLMLKYVVQLTPEQYEVYLGVADNLKMFINDDEVTYQLVELDNEYRFVYTITITDNSVSYLPKLTYNDKTLLIEGYSAKTLADYYLNNLSSVSLVDEYKDCLLAIAK